MFYHHTFNKAKLLLLLTTSKHTRSHIPSFPPWAFVEGLLLSEWNGQIPCPCGVLSPFQDPLYSTNPIRSPKDSIWIASYDHKSHYVTSYHYFSFLPLLFFPFIFEILNFLSEYPSCSTQTKSKREKLFLYITKSSRIKVHLSEKLDTVAKKLLPKPLFFHVFPVTTQP